MGVASIEALSGGDERAGPESTRVGAILRRASPACGLSLAGRSRHLAQYADVGGRCLAAARPATRHHRSEEHTSELQSLMRISYAVFCLKKKTTEDVD